MNWKFWQNIKNMRNNWLLNGFLRKKPLLPYHKYLHIDLSFYCDKETAIADWERFVGEYNPVLEEIGLSDRTNKENFYTGSITIEGTKVHIHSPRFPNRNFDRDECIKKCAEEREAGRVLELHKNELDVEGRIARVKAGKEIPCYRG